MNTLTTEYTVKQADINIFTTLNKYEAERIASSNSEYRISTINFVLDETLPEALKTSSCLKEINNLHNIPQDPKYHPEGDAYTHTLNVYNTALILQSRIQNKYRKAFLTAALCHDLGKAVTTEETDKGIHSYGHEKQSVKLFDDMCDRICPNMDPVNRNLIRSLIETHMQTHNKRNTDIVSTNKFFNNLWISAKDDVKEKLKVYAYLEIADKFSDKLYTKEELDKNLKFQFAEMWWNDRINIYSEIKYSLDIYYPELEKYISIPAHDIYKFITDMNCKFVPVKNIISQLPEFMKSFQDKYSNLDCKSLGIKLKNILSTESIMLQAEKDQLAGYKRAEEAACMHENKKYISSKIEEVRKAAVYEHSFNEHSFIDEDPELE